MNYKKIWEDLKDKLTNANENAHPRFKGMEEKPTIQIFKVLRIMNELETNQIKKSNRNRGGHKKKSAVRPKLKSRAPNNLIMKAII